MISQNLFDETLLENQDVFDYTDDQAVKETIDEFFQQKQRLEHISLTHPLSSKGKRDRELQRRFVNSLVVENNIDVATLILKGLQQNHQQQQQQQQSPITQERQDNEKDKIIDEEEEEDINDGDSEEKNSNQRMILSLWHLLLHNNIWTKLIDSVAVAVANDNNNDNDNAVSLLSTTSAALIDFVVALFPDSSLSLHPLAHDLKKIISPFWFEENNRNRNVNVDVDNDHDKTTKTSVCYRLLEESVAAAPTTTTIIDNNNNLPLSLVQMARILCNGCEDNKKSFVKAGIERCQQIDNKTGLELLVDCLGDGNNIDFGDGTSSSSSSSSSELSSSFLLARETCRLFAVLSKYQPLAEPIEPSAKPGAAPLVSSAHANVKEFHKTGVLPRLHKIAKGCLQQLRQDDADTNNDVDVIVVVPVNETADDDDNDDVDRNYIQHRQELLCESLSALRTMAIDNDIVQNMIALGILDTVRNSLEVVVQVATAMTSSSSSTSSSADTTVPSSLLILTSSSLALATATLGLVRNLCANDEVKTTICKSSLPCILQVMQHFLDDDKGVPESQQVQQQHNKGEQIAQSNNTMKESRRTKSHAILEEHACGILAAMALRQPQNAHAIVEGDGHVLIFQAMRAFPFKVTLQRQACLAVRNIASRLESDVDKTKLLDAGAEDVLLSIAGSHPASSEEAYAALRDLGLTPDIFKLDEYGKATRSTTESFGTVKSNFRPIYE
ncbi:hypothetical protein FRACYDRAFT_240493 [Fragilariopsis cylindrus CCMP1102]|uniref:ARM repeat-containing protein n=1 Tax=Fragilariopsis cylindrus CCMP1102 TaxID=635003 RepID=A0A1E7FC89_9STRA|nr:hypothetical protein FRACYDRAFT_240493 [Fragilariopsis cylindrus CCMP1102]|eukprot:OEU15798.1 hypothetical protein FRACYDRAFT_240493 [Fragilariopsis cylindrus CCMP1102]